LNITLENTGTLTAEITLMIEPEDYREQINEELKNQARRANIPGFRPGKAPVNLVRRMIGKSLAVETITKLVNQQLDGYIKEQNLRLLGEPMPKQEKTAEDFDEYGEKPIDFIFEVGLAPDVSLNFDLPALPVQYEVTVDEDSLTQEIENYRLRLGGIETPEVSGPGDLIYAQLSEVDETGAEVEGGISRMVGLSDSRIPNKAFLEQFTGMKLNDKVLVSNLLEAADTPEQSLAALFIEEFTPEEVQGKRFTAEARRITRLTKAEMNPEFFKALSEHVGLQLEEPPADEAALRSALREFLEGEYQKEALSFYRTQLREALKAAHPLSFPEDFLRRWMLRTGENATPESIEKEFPSLIDNLHWSLITGKILEEYPDVRVTEEEMNEQLHEYVHELMGRFRGENQPDEEVYLKYVRENEELMNLQYRRVRDRKLFEFLSDKIRPQQELIAASAFQALVKDTR
jgi:trigger factor